VEKTIVAKDTAISPTVTNITQRPVSVSPERTRSKTVSHIESQPKQPPPPQQQPSFAETRSKKKKKRKPNSPLI